MAFFSLRYMKRWKEEGENGYIFSLLKKYICSVWMDDGTDGWKSSFRPRRPLLYKNIRSPLFYLFLVSVFLSSFFVFFAFLFFFFFSFSFIFFFK